jgi:alpha-1,2-mannosyltransferase
MRPLFAWKSAAEVTRGAGIFAAFQALVLLLFVIGTHGGFGKLDHPTTVDFASFYAAGALADAGAPRDAYDDAALQRAEEQATAPGVNHEFFFNPPTLLLIMAPFARLPYLVSFYLFELITVAAWLVLGTRTAGGGTAATLALMAVPSFWWVLAEGQNSFLSAALMAGGLLALPRRPVLAGIAFGALCYKPQLGLMIPVALVAGREWRALAAAAATVLLACAAVTLLYGAGVWGAFLAMGRHQVSNAIDNGVVSLAGRVDLRGAASFLGLGGDVALAVWLAALVAAGVTVAWLWRRGALETRNAGLAAAVLVATPFALFYDLVMASLAAAWLVRAGRRDGFLPGESLAFGVLMVCVLLAAHPVVRAMHVPFGAVVGPVLLSLCVRRQWLLKKEDNSHDDLIAN